MSNNTIFNNHPLIKNSNQYFLEKKYISISSEDRDITKYPTSSEFEMFLPQEYLNVASARLHSWSFPSNYNVFGLEYYNTSMTFKMGKLYNPTEHSFESPLTEGIFAALYYNSNTEYIINIENGFYNPEQMVTELTNKFNYVVTITIESFFNDPSLWNGNDYTEAKILFEKSKGYDRFKIVYNSVSQQIWFGNTADQFILTNKTLFLKEKNVIESNCRRRNKLPELVNWGLPYYLGFNRCNATSITTEEYIETLPQDASENISVNVPRFFYGDAVPGSGDNGYWLLPELPGAIVYFIEAPSKISFMGPGYIYMEIDGWNCIDETIPYNLSLYNSTTNQTNGVVNSCFAKIPVPATPIAEWFDKESAAYKYWNPPAERISKIKLKIRYHNGMLALFGNFEYSFMIELNLLKPQQEKSYSIVNAYDLGQQSMFSNRFI